MIDGEELALAIGMVSALSSNPLSLAARALTGGTISNDELPDCIPDWCIRMCSLSSTGGGAGWYKRSL